MEKGTTDGDAVVVKPGNIVSTLLRSKLDDDDPELGLSDDDTDSGLLICYEPVEKLSVDCQIAVSFDLLENFFNSNPDLLSEMTTWVEGKQKPKVVYKTYLRKCRICQRAFTNQKDLDEHKQIHFEMDRSFRCKTCKKLFFDIRNLKNHEKVHVREKSKCQICLKEFRYEKYLNQHMKQHHESTPSKEAEDSNDSNCSSEDENEPSYSCEHCGKHFSNESKLATHSKMHVSHKAFKCAICPKAFSKEKNLISHLTFHDIYSFPCKLCGKVMKTRTKLDAHMKIHYSH